MQAINRTAMELRLLVKQIVNEGRNTFRGIALEADIDPAQFSRFIRGTSDKGLSKKKLAALSNVVSLYITSSLKPLDVNEADLLGQKLQDDQLILVTGSTLSMFGGNLSRYTHGFQYWSLLMDQLSEALHLTRSDFAGPLELFDYVVHTQPEGRDRLAEAMQKELESVFKEHSEVHQRLLTFPWNCIMTTSYDQYLERVMERDSRFYRAGRDGQSTHNIMSPVHIFGDCADLHTITSDEFQNWPSRQPQLWQFLMQQLPGKTALLVGFGFDDPDFTALITHFRSMLKNRHKKMYAWLWRATESQKEILRVRDNINATSFLREEDWLNAIEQLHNASQALDEKLALQFAEIPTGGRGKRNHYERQQYCQALERMHPSSAAEIYLANSRRYADIAAGVAGTYQQPRFRVTHKAGSVGVETFQDLKESPDFRKGVCFIYGKSGVGKSTFMKRVLNEQAAKWLKDAGQPFPVLVSLGNWESVMTGGRDKLIDYLAKALPTQAEISRRKVRQWCDNPVLWLLDEFDNIRIPKERTRLLEEVMRFCATKSADRFVIATRRMDPMIYELSPDCMVCEMLPFNKDQAKAVLNEWGEVVLGTKDSMFPVDEYNSAVEDVLRSEDIYEIPFLLVWSFIEYLARRRFPSNPCECIEFSARSILRSWGAYDEQRDGGAIGTDLCHNVLCQLALVSLQQGRNVFSEREIDAELEKILLGKELREDELERCLVEFKRDAKKGEWILVSVAPNRFGFVSLHFRDYYAACALDQDADLAEQLRGQCEWDDVLRYCKRASISSLTRIIHESPAADG